MLNYLQHREPDFLTNDNSDLFTFAPLPLSEILCLLAGMALQAQDVDIAGTWTMYEMACTRE